MILLYEHPLSPYAQKVKIALRRMGVPFDLQRPGGIGSGASAGDFAEGNPRMEVPFLVDGDLRIFDSTIMLDYIEESFPDRTLMPAAPAARARVRMIEDVMDTHYEAINWGLSELRYFNRATGAAAEALRAEAGAQIAAIQRWLAAELGDADWFGGAGFGRADLCVVPFLNGSDWHGFPPVEPALAAWLARANALPEVAQTSAEAKETLPTIGKAYRDGKAGAFRRQYRDHRLEWMIRSGGIDVVVTGLERGDIRFTDLTRL
ncbi:MAG: glutathione S-transferase family protein [Pseudomonadota bacterium]|nr:glutathione S-transferase family protein [Pseudomonadota bacterium]